MKMSFRYIFKTIYGHIIFFRKFDNHKGASELKEWATASDNMHRVTESWWSPAMWFLARDVIYTSRDYATMSVSVCLSICLWRKCIGAL